jgi:hypothetical protein
MVTMTGELEGTKATSPRYDYRSVTPKQGWTQKVLPNVLASRSRKPPPPADSDSYPNRRGHA